MEMEWGHDLDDICWSDKLIQHYLNYKNNSKIQKKKKKKKWTVLISINDISLSICFERSLKFSENLIIVKSNLINLNFS